MPENTVMSPREYAAHRKTSLNAVQKAIARGRISATQLKNGRWEIDPVQADVEWEANTDESRDTEGGKATGSTYQQIRTVHESKKLELTKIEIEKAKGTLCYRADFVSACSRAGNILKKAMENMAERIGPELAGEDDPVKVTNMLVAEVNKALTNAGEAIKSIGI